MKKTLLSTLLLIAVVFGGFYLVKDFTTTEKESSIAQKRKEFNKFLDEHPYNNRNLTEEEWQKIPKADRPDLAMEQDYLSMIDPNTRTVPYERLLPAFELTVEKLRTRNQLNNNQVSFNPVSNDPFGSAVFDESQNRARPSLSPSSDVIPSEAVTVGGDPVVWEERGPDNVGGRTRAILWDPNDATNRRVFAAGVSGGIWVNDNVLDPNSSWRAIDDFLSNLAVNSITADPNNPMTFYAGTGEGWFNVDAVRGVGIFRSTDGGNTWSLMPSTTGPEFAYVQKIKVTSSGTILAATRAPNRVDGGIFRSTNNGASFTQVLASSGADIEIAANGDIYASRGIFSPGTISKSVNDGADWTDITPSAGSNPARIELAVAPSDSDIVYAMAHNASNNGIDYVQRSSNGGSTWESLTIPTHNDGCASTATNIARNQAWFDLILAVSPVDPNIVIAGGVDLARTEDGGQTWTQISEWADCSGIENVHADHHAIEFRPGNPSEALFGTDGGIYYSSNAGPAFTPAFETRNKNYSVTQFYAVATDNVSGSEYYIAGAQDNGTQQLRADLNASAVRVISGDGAFAHVDQLNRTWQLGASQNGRVRHSSNGGVSFQSLSTTGGANFINQSDYDNTAGILYSTGGDDQIKRIANVKTTNPSAQEILNLNLGGRQTSAIRANTNTANRIFVGTEGGRIYRIDNANATPTATEITNNISAVGNVSSIDVGATDDELIATFSNFGVTSVWYSTNGGTTWVSKDEASHGLPDMPVRWALFNPNNTQQVLLATELGVWSANDITAANPGWEPSNEGLANTRVTMIQYRESDGMVVVSTHGRGLFTSNIFSTDDVAAPTAVSFTPADDEPAANPLDANLEIEFDEPINIGTGNITLFLASDNSVVESIDVTSNQVNVSGTRAIINPSNDLLPLTAYYVQIDSGTFEDNFGTAYGGIADSTSWNFTTFDGDEPPVVNVPISDLTVDENSANQVIDLSTVFNDADNDNSLITFNVVSNSNPSAVSTNLAGTNLTLSFPTDKIGIAEIVVSGTSNGKTVEDSFNVTVNSIAPIIFDQSGPRGNSGWPEGMYTNGIIRNVDDFVVPGGQSWDISTLQTQAFILGGGLLNLQSVNVIIYNDDNGAPGSVFEEQTIPINQGQIIGGIESSPGLTVRLNNTITVTSGTYWLSVHPNFNTAFDAANVRYFWFIGTSAGNSFREFGDGMFTANNQRHMFTVDGTANIMDNAPTVANPIADIELGAVPAPNPMVLDLSSTFTDVDNDDSLITIEVIENTNTNVLTTSVNNQELSLDFTGNFGSTVITLRATSNGLTVDESFNVTLLSSLFSQSGTAIGSTPSQLFPDFANRALEAADNFTVPTNEDWDIFRVSAQGSNSNTPPEQAFFIIYEDDNGLPGNVLFTSPVLPVEFTINDSSFRLTLDTPVTLSSGDYWISVQTFQAFNGANQWFWQNTSDTSPNNFVWQDTTNLVGGPASWAVRTNNSGLIFSLFGQINSAPLSTRDINIGANDFVLLGNPTDGLFQVGIADDINSLLMVQVYNLAGELVLSKTVSGQAQKTFEVDLRGKANGLYILNVYDNRTSKSFKLLKQ